MAQYSREEYASELRREGRNYAKDHSYGEWLWFRRWESGEIDNGEVDLSRSCGSSGPVHCVLVLDRRN